MHAAMLKFTILAVALMAGHVAAFVRCGCPVQPPMNAQAFHDLRIFASGTTFDYQAKEIDISDCLDDTKPDDTATNHVKIECDTMHKGQKAMRCGQMADSLRAVVTMKNSAGQKVLAQCCSAYPCRGGQKVDTTTPPANTQPPPVNEQPPPAVHKSSSKQCKKH
ncbi:uncharacterized protein L969DRAFT_313810 [Mixia osmundae IAM 14324]|uniref:Cyanovirin-N domain-containing protein n=1 Tax=Mixia osmundae (strain CBS 9802 / IAM 14324 / JCM 22182 / KY 12970) TaxID=764103 RepID=G7DYH6_MIXOS|nr:uncharacterized protein L969DRAFT_313810 [Mixia osmundae IAM 14324]KEI41537.1 hypothetical protein L969DRAFT_313810 [Mixia osmundae IAM 14324]GAA95636.1 hypothetical protein E5Q_02292 [Mixia osmundae IAM 14324]